MARTKYKKKEKNGNVYFFHRLYNKNLRKPKDLYGKTASELDDKIKKIESELERGVKSDKTIFGVYINTWLTDVCSIGKKDSTMDRYFSIYKNHIENKDIYYMQLKSLTALDVQNYYGSLARKGVSKSTIENIQKILKPCIRYAFTQGKIMIDFSKSILLPPEAKVNTKGVRRASKAIPKDKELELIRHCKNTKVESLIITALNTGLRRGELLALTWNDIDIAKKTIDINKTYNPKVKTPIGDPKTKCSRRIIPMNSIVVSTLIMHKSEQNKQILLLSNKYKKNNLVFPNDFGHYFSTSTIDRNLKDLAIKTGLDSLNMHDFRDTFATRLYEKSGNLKMVQALLGHSDISTTANVYTHVSIDHALEYIEKLDSL